MLVHIGDECMNVHLLYIILYVVEVFDHIANNVIKPIKFDRTIQKYSCDPLALLLQGTISYISTKTKQSRPNSPNYYTNITIISERMNG